MIVGTGVDLTEVPRLKTSIEQYGQKFLDRLFTTGEQAYCERAANRFERYAARFAAKEAGMKAIGTGLANGVSFTDFEVTNDVGGKPTLLLHGTAAAIAQQMGVTRVHISLTHTAVHAIAFVTLET